MKYYFPPAALVLSLYLAAPFLFAAADPKAPTDPKLHWAFAPPRQPPVPSLRHADRVRTAVDAFVVAALEQKGLSLGREADRATLLRRVSLGLTGLPPSQAELAAFQEDRSADAFERMVERYLASPRYGERWGKYWLDTARYADSNGYFNADSERAGRYPYPRYVDPP